MTTPATTPAARSRRGDALVANGVALVLGTAAFSVSFTHVMTVAAEHGQGGWVAKAIATSVELMALASVAELRRRKAKGEPAWIAIAVLLLGVSMSLASNLATAAAGAWGKTMAAWPAVAFLAVAALVESRTGGPQETEAQSRTDGTVRTDEAPAPRTAAVRTAAPAPYGFNSPGTEPLRTHDALRTPQSPAPALASRMHEGAEGPQMESAAAAAQAMVAAPLPVPADPPRPVAPEVAEVRTEIPAAAVNDVPVPAAARSDTPALTLLSGGNGSDSVSDTSSDTVSAAESGITAAPAAPQVAASSGSEGWRAGSSGLLVPSAYAAADRPRPVLIVPGREEPTGRSAPARTGKASAARTNDRTQGPAKSRTAPVPAPRTQSPAQPRTDRPARTDVVDSLVAAIRTDAAWRPDYTALISSTGYQRSFLEKCVRDARQLAERAAA